MPGETASERRSGAGWKLALRVTVSAAFLALLYTKIPDLHGVIPDDHPARTAALVAAAATTLLLSFVLSSWRWQQVLVLFDAPVPLRTLTGHYLAGQFVGNVLPSTIGGDVLRVTRCAKTVGSTTTAFASVVLERLSGMIALPLLVFVGLACRPSLFGVAGTWLAATVAAATLGGLALILFAAGHPAIAGRFAGNENWTRFIGAVFQGVDRGRRNPRQLLRVLTIAVVYQLSVICSYLFVFHALELHVATASAAAFVPAVSMLQVLPISFNGLGVREYALVAFRHGLGVRSAAAGTAGLLWYGSLVVVSMLGAPILAAGHRRPPTGTFAPPIEQVS